MMALFPFRDSLLRTFEDEFNRAFDNFTITNWSKPETLKQRTYPKTDIYQDGENLVFEMLLPFTKKEDIKIELQRDKDYAEYYILTVSGECTKDKDRKYWMHELRRSTFCRKFWLTSDVVSRASTPVASMTDGILRLVFQGALAVDSSTEPVKISVA